MHTHKKDSPLGYLPKAPLYLRNLVTAHTNSTFNKESENKTFRLKAAEVHYVFPFSILSLLVWHTHALIYCNPSARDWNPSSSAGKPFSKYLRYMLELYHKGEGKVWHPSQLNTSINHPLDFSSNCGTCNNKHGKLCEPDQKNHNVEKLSMGKKEIYCLYEVSWLIMLPTQHFSHSQWLLQRCI